MQALEIRKGHISGWGPSGQEVQRKQAFPHLGGQDHRQTSEPPSLLSLVLKTDTRKLLRNERS